MERSYVGETMNAQPPIPNQRSVIDRRALASAIEAAVAQEGGTKARPAILALLREALAGGRAELARRLMEHPSAGYRIVHGHAFLADQLIRVIHDHVTRDLYPRGNASAGERLALIAVGGYGRGEMAPHSDVDIAFVTPGKRTAWCEQVIEALLYTLWDLGLKVGHSTRSLDEVVRMGKGDLTVRTALLEGRYLWGDQALFEETYERFRSEVVAGSHGRFIAEKLAEREARHQRMGDSRYVVEPNVKDGKGGLRDLQTLYWIGKYVHGARIAAELVDKGLFTAPEYRSFRRAEGFMLAVRCHLHTITGRAEDRLTFDLQPEIARRMRFAERPGKQAVERFMQFYFLQAKHVGHLSGLFLAEIEEQQGARKSAGLIIDTLRRAGLTRGAFLGLGWGRKVGDYAMVAGKLAAPGDDWFRQNPVRLVEIFLLAEREGLEIHPETMRMARRDAPLVTGRVRRDEWANALFLELLAGRRDPETALRWMNEAGVLGRFVPDFGKVNAQMQFDMYHHYTVDEHTIRAIGLVSRIERGELADDHPRASAIVPRLTSRRVLYVAVLLHDIAKGRGGDHSVIGEQIARRLCPRLGLDEEETAHVAWLVRWHLLMSATAFKRDLADPKTIRDFAAAVSEPERLRLLLALTVVDIRAVGPGVWNGWKRRLLGDLYTLAEEQLREGGSSPAPAQRSGGKRAKVRELLGREATLVSDLGERFDEDYWLGEPADIIARNLSQYAASRRLDEPLSIHCEHYSARGASLVTVIAGDVPGLFFRIAAGIHLAGGNIIDARIHTTSDGVAVDNFLVQDPFGGPFDEREQHDRLERAIGGAIGDRAGLAAQLARRPLPRARAEHFRVTPRVKVDNEASDRFSVIEISAADRPALLSRLAHAMFEAGLVINSAHIGNYGERAVDSFYVTDPAGAKILCDESVGEVERALMAAIVDGEPAIAGLASELH